MLREIGRMVDAFERGALTRRELVSRIGAFAAATAAAHASAVQLAGSSTQQKPSTFEAKGLNHIALRVTDVARSRDFYIKHLGLSVRDDRGRGSCFLNCGDQFVALFRGREAKMDHYSYTIDDYDAGKAVKTLKSAGLEPRREGNRVYFPDPDGLTVQVSPA